MKSFKVLITLLLLPLTLWAQDSDVVPSEFVINPQSVRERLSDGGLTMIQAANRLRRAKYSVEAARGRLLPSLNLGVAAGTMANPSFLISSVDYVLPFLVPAKWFDIKKAKNLEQAEKYAFLLTEMNQFASMYSLVINVQNDFNVRSIVAQDLEDAILIETLVMRNLELGTATESDLDRAQALVASTEVRLLRLSELLVEEIATLKQVLNLPTSTRLKFENFQVEPSNLEHLTLDQAIEQVVKLAPEKKQLVYLLKAAQTEKFTKVWGFISGASSRNSSVGLNPGENASFAFLSASIGGMFNIGFDYFANVRLAQTNIKEMQLRDQEISNEMQKVVSTLLGRFNLVNDRLQRSIQAENLMNQVFINDQRRYENGEIPLIQLFDSQAKVRQASQERLRAQTDLSLLRVSMHRLNLEAQFEQIKGCEVLPKITPPRRRWGRTEPMPICDPKSTEKRFSGQE